MSVPDLTGRNPAQELRGLVLVLPGGADQNTKLYRADGLQARRARMLARQIGGRLLERGIGVWLGGYRVVGWNDGHPDHPVPSPVPDTRTALAGLAERHPGVPVVTVGHSMGGRTAVATADAPNVAGVVALAPWLPEDEPVEPLAGKEFAAAHGRWDPITSARKTRLFTERAREVASSARFQDMGPIGHYLLRRIAAWNSFAAEQATRMLAPATGAAEKGDAGLW